MIKTNIEYMRDPFIVAHDGAYYAYGTGVIDDDWDNTMWICYKNTSGKLDGEWKRVEKNIAVVPDAAVKNRWAPEVHKYNGSFYMFTTYFSSEHDRRGCTVLKSDSPEGPFVEVSNGIITPHSWDCIDGTLYVDEAGQPWMVYVWEWCSTGDGIGRMAASRMSSDLTRLISDPIILFKANEPSWAAENNSTVTDGCFMYKTENGELLMLWSNFNSDGYCVAVARSDNGRLDGNWSHDEELIFSKALSGEYGGGHGMIFTDFDGKKYMSVHTPNSPCDGHGERTVLIPIYEENGRLVTEF
ncbi:MAG: family 43 glycosylhydrolase [Clostridia bacterium]|nr:family 43 glycosylhydrolase [Clostridia bacterium]